MGRDLFNPSYLALFVEPESNADLVLREIVQWDDRGGDRNHDGGGVTIVTHVVDRGQTRTERKGGSREFLVSLKSSVSLNH